MTEKSGTGIPPPREQVASYLTQQVENGNLAKGEGIPSRKVLAKKFGVSSRTISHALRLLTASGLVEHVPGKGVFVAGDKKKKGLESLQTIGVIGWYASHLRVGERMHRGVDYGEGILNALARYAHEAAMNVLLIPRTEREPIEVDQILACRPDCIITLGVELRPETVLDFRRAGIPAVLGNRHLEHLGVSYADFDTEGCFARAVDIFYQRGHRRIATITDTFRTRPIGPRCRRAFYLALAEHGLPYSFRDYYYEFTSPRPRDAADAAREHHEIAKQGCHKMLDYPEPPTAFYTHTRQHAEGIIAAARERGMEIGKDLSLITDSWDNKSETLSYFHGSQDALGKKLVESVEILIKDPHQICQTNIPKVFTDKGSIATLGTGKEST